MNIYWWVLVIFVTALGLMLWAAWYTGEADRGKLHERAGDPRPLPGELPRAGRFAVELHEPPFLGSSQTGQPFSLADDTGPLLFLSDKMAANAALEREVRALGAEAEAKIPSRWR